MNYKIIKKVFGPLLHKPCWNIRRGQWKSAISFQFGKPSLKIYERTKNRPAQKPVLVRRTMVLKGQWNLLVDGCHWKAHSMGKKIGDWRSKEIPDGVAYGLSGQILREVIIKPKSGESIFVFDLGGRFETRPRDNGTQWSFFTPSGKVLSYRADGKYAFALGNKPTPETAWKEFSE